MTGPHAGTSAPDCLAAFRPLLAAVRWGTLAVGLLLSTHDMAARRWPTIVWLAVLFGFALWRTLVPPTHAPGDLPSLAEGGGRPGAPSRRGGDDRLLELAPRRLPSHRRRHRRVGRGHGLRPGVGRDGGRGGVRIAARRQLPAGTSLDTAGQWSIELLLVAVVASYGRRLFGEAEERTSVALDRIASLVEANQLLSALHRVAQTLPASLDLDEVLASTLARLRDLVGFDVATILLRDETRPSWTVAAGQGVQPWTSLEDAALPPPLATAVASASGLVVDDLAVGGPGLTRLARSGLYTALRARGVLVALVVLEHSLPTHFGRRELELLDGMAVPAALAIDNARWFARLRMLGAEEERTGIARDLHDRIGQAPVYLAFELDRLARRADTSPMHRDVLSLQEDLRRVVSEVRETLVDLRTDVSDEQGVAEALQLFVGRVGTRSGLAVSVDAREEGRLPLPRERELWRIAQEAITNVERHAAARRLSVRWRCDGSSALLEVLDDGKGFSMQPASPRAGAYGLVGMWERADAIGARLEIISAPGQGTLVRCRLEQR